MCVFVFVIVNSFIVPSLDGDKRLFLQVSSKDFYIERDLD